MNTTRTLLCLTRTTRRRLVTVAQSRRSRVAVRRTIRQLVIPVCSMIGATATRLLQSFRTASSKPRRRRAWGPPFPAYLFDRRLS